MAKLRVGILFGGRSGEHEVSLLSAASVLNAIDKTKYEMVPIGITKEGRWLTAEHAERLLKGKSADENPAQLRAGDPDATPGAAVLKTGESVVVPPAIPNRSQSRFEGGREFAARVRPRH
jgi:D-alanine-D-alanine ligase